MLKQQHDKSNPQLSSLTANTSQFHSIMFCQEWQYSTVQFIMKSDKSTILWCGQKGMPEFEVSFHFPSAILSFFF